MQQSVLNGIFWHVAGDVEQKTNKPEARPSADVDDKPAKNQKRPAGKEHVDTAVRVCCVCMI